MSDNFTVLDLFAGCGGLSKGFELAGGFDVVVANEFWDPAADSYEKNHPETKMVRGDITKPEIKAALFKEFENRPCDVIIGGPPCQAYSNAGFRDPDDPRGKLFLDYVAIVDKLQPKIFVMENVKGLLTMKHEKEVLTDEERKQVELLREMEREKRDLLLQRKTSKSTGQEIFDFSSDLEKRLRNLEERISSHKKLHLNLEEKVTDQILRSFKRIGYDVQFKLLNSANFGVPQKRERVIFIGTKTGDDRFQVEYPVNTHSQEGESGLLAWRTVRDAIDDLKVLSANEAWNHIFTSHTEGFIQKIKNTPVGKGVFGFSDAFHRNLPDVPSRTVKENHGGVLVHYEADRVMTPRELARLQSFPDDFVFRGTKSQILVQIGNAVPPLLGKAIADSVAKSLKGARVL